MDRSSFLFRAENGYDLSQIIQRVQRDVLLMNEFDYDSQQLALSLFLRAYLEVSQGGQPPIRFPHVFTMCRCPRKAG